MHHPVLEAYAPHEIARAVEAYGVTKANNTALRTLILGVLGGSFKALGVLFYLELIAGGETQPLLLGVAYSLGMLLIVVGGAELFSSNNLVAMAWASRLIRLRLLLRNWGLVLGGNAVGASATALLIAGAGIHRTGRLAEVVGDAATHRAGLPLESALILGVLCNALLCMGVWLSHGSRSIVDKFVALALPTSAFVASGFEHGVANMFIYAYAALVADVSAIDAGHAVATLACVVVGNILGGTLMVALVYWLLYRASPPQEATI